MLLISEPSLALQITTFQVYHFTAVSIFLELIYWRRYAKKKLDSYYICLFSYMLVP